jgi:hypothetical protein
MRVRLIHSMGDDLTVVNAARQSTDGVEATEIGPRERGLIEYLASGLTTRIEISFGWTSLIARTAKKPKS